MGTGLDLARAVKDHQALGLCQAEGRNLSASVRWEGRGSAKVPTSKVQVGSHSAHQPRSSVVDSTRPAYRPLPRRAPTALADFFRRSRLPAFPRTRTSRSSPRPTLPPPAVPSSLLSTTNLISTTSSSTATKTPDPRRPIIREAPRGADTCTAGWLVNRTFTIKTPGRRTPP